jgi:uncharacterized protein YndB with AHSA1/START domain
MTTSPPTSDRPIGTLRREGSTGVVRMEDHFDTDPDDLWDAVTSPSRLARWIAEIEGDLRVGGGFVATFTSGWHGPGRVDACERPHRLLVTMRPGCDDETTIEALIRPEGAGAWLVVEERGLPLSEYAVHGAGWQAHLEDLATYLRDEPCTEWRQRWLELTPTYEQRAALIP